MDFTQEFARVAGELDTAERGRNWAQVAALRAERDGLTEAQRVAELDAARLALVAKSRKQEAERRALEAESRTLQNRWEGWLSRLEDVNALSRDLWAEYGTLERAAADLGQRCERAGATSHYVGRLSPTAVKCRDGRGGALVWRPRLA